MKFFGVYNHDLRTFARDWKGLIFRTPDRGDADNKCEEMLRGQWRGQTVEVREVGAR